MNNRDFSILALIAAIIVTAIALAAIFSEALSCESTWVQATYLIAILTLSLILYPRISLPFALKATVIWLCIGLMIILAYRFYRAA